MLKGIGPIRFDRLLDQRLQCLQLQVESQFAGFELLDIQQLINQQREALRISVGEAQQFPGGGRKSARRLADDQPQGATNGGQRGTQLMRDHRQKLTLEPLDTRQLSDVEADSRNTLWQPI